MKPEFELIAVKLGENLREARSRTDLVIWDVAQRCDVHHSVVGGLETGTRLPRIDTLVKLAAVLDVSVNDLFKGVPRWVPGTDRPGRFVPQEEGQKPGVAESDCIGGDPRPHDAED